MNRGLAKVLTTSGVGAAAGALAAFIGYRFREPETLSLETTIKVDDLTISDELWCIVGLTLLGALVCGGIAAVCTYKKGPGRMLLALAIAMPVGALACWGARVLMDQITYATLGPPSTKVDVFAATFSTFMPWIIWQVGCGFALSFPIAFAIGPNKYTLVRALLGSGLVMALGFVLSQAIGFVMLFFAIGTFAVGGNATDVAQTGDVMYLFVLGASAGIAFGLAEAVYKPAWLKSIRGPSEGRNWTLQGQLSRIGCQEGVQVYLPPDGTIAPVHAQIQGEDDAHFIVDLAGGLTINGAPQQNAWLQDGDRIGIGSALIVYRNRIDSKPKEQPRQQTQIQLTPATYELLDAMGGRHLLRQGKLTIGRDETCDIALTWEPSVSRRHAEIEMTPAGVFLRDLNSTNGTFVNGERISMVALGPGTEFLLGKCRLRLEQSS